MKLIADLKRQVIRSVRRTIAPHLWPSGYVPRTMIFAFVRPAKRWTEVNRSMGKVFNQELTVLQGFYSHGTIDAVGGGMMCTPFESYCLEDLLAIEKWLGKNFAKEIDNVRIYRQLNKK